jgi:nucleotide-binding universal stress UspA family protein
VVHCWRHIDEPDPALWDERDLATRREQRQVWVAESIAGYRATYPDVQVTSRVLEGRPQDVLAGKSEHAQLVVVGSRGHSGLTGLLLGSVSQSLLHHAHCSVAIVRP